MVREDSKTPSGRVNIYLLDLYIVIEGLDGRNNKIQNLLKHTNIRHFTLLGELKVSGSPSPVE